MLNISKGIKILYNTKMSAINKILTSSRIDNKSAPTHISMGDIKGKYSLNREMIEKLFESSSDDELCSKGICEIPQTYSALRLDFDFEEESTIIDSPIKSLFDMDNFLNKIIPDIQIYLKNNIIDFKPEHADCSILTKNPYKTEKNTIKHGLHLQFPNCFISKKDFDLFEQKFKNLEGIDINMSNKPWLLYNQTKGLGKTSYKIKNVLKFDGTLVLPEKYFENYKCYQNGIQIKFTKKIELYYNRIFSIIPYDRLTVEMSHINDSPVIEKNKSWDDCDDEVQLYGDDIRDIIENYISDEMDNSYSIGEWDGNFLKLKRIKSFLCPTTKSRDHDNRGAYITINKDNGKLYLGCYCNEAKGLAIGTYKTVQKIEKKSDNSVIKLDKIYPNEIINKNNIGSYVPRLEKADVVCMRSNMMTYKTQNLKELMGKYKKILIVSFRVSLTDEYMKQFSDEKFELYSNFKGLVYGDRIITQIDSLYKLRGDFDLLILDEFVYTMDHLHSFVKRKKDVWDALNEYIKYTKKIICCDALLDQKTIQIFKNNKRSTIIVENIYESFKNRSVNFIDFVDSQSTIKYILDQLKVWKKIFIPTNSKTLGKKILLFLENEGVKVGMDSGDDDVTPSDEWKKFDVFITTPTNIAGISCNDIFGKTIAYFTSASCSAQMCSQMLHRVRNTESNTVDIIFNYSKMGNFYPIKLEEIKTWIKEKDDLIINSGLKIDYVRNKIVADDYYINFIEYIRKENLSKIMFKQVLTGILNIHGYNDISNTQKDKDMSITEILKESIDLEVIKKESKIMFENDKKQTRENIGKAFTLSDKQFKIINEKYRKSIGEKLSIRKYHLQKTYGCSIELTDKFILKFEKIINCYKNLEKMNCIDDNLTEFIEKSINNYEKEHEKDDNIIRLHEKRHLLKIWAIDNIVKMLGFNNIFDKKIIHGYPYLTVKKFLTEHGDKISTLFNCQRVNWENIDVTDKDDKKKISNFITAKIKSVCNITFSNKHKGRNSVKEEYILKGLEIWEDNGLQILVNEKARLLYMENFKVVSSKKLISNCKNTSKIWKCVTEYISIK